MLVSTIIRDVSRDLNDQIPGYEYTRWPQDQLLSYLQEALIEVSSVYRSLFVERVVVKITSGTNWQKACDCSHIVRVLGLSDRDGNINKYLTKSDDNDANVWAGDIRGCASGKASDVTSYAINAVDDTQFRIYPPLLPGQSTHAVIECYKIPTDVDGSYNVPDRVVPAIKQWMLYRSLLIDSENNNAIVNVAKMHMETYTSLVQAMTAENMAREAQHGNSVRTQQSGASS